MRKLTKTEKRLSVILIVAVFAMANFYGLGYLFDLLSVWAPDAAVRQRILVNNPQTLYGFA